MTKIVRRCTFRGKKTGQEPTSGGSRNYRLASLSIPAIEKRLGRAKPELFTNGPSRPLIGFKIHRPRKRKLQEIRKSRRRHKLDKAWKTNVLLKSYARNQK